MLEKILPVNTVITARTHELGLCSQSETLTPTKVSELEQFFT